MGLGDLLGNIFGKPKSDQDKKCPNCGASVNIKESRCPSCGTHIKAMFRRKCPKCNRLNELDSKFCSECRYSFEAEFERARHVEFICPICGFRCDALLTSCPACNTKFI